MTSSRERSATADGWSVLRPQGPLDAASAPELRAALDCAAEGPQPHLLIDLTEVDFLDSTALGVLVGALRRVRVAGGVLRVVCANPTMLELIDLAGLTAALDVHPDRLSALAAGPLVTGPTATAGESERG